MNLVRLFNTVRYLKPKQVFYQFRKKRILSSKPTFTKEPIMPDFEGGLFVHELDACEDFLSRFEINKIMKGELTFLHHSRVVNWTNWAVPDVLPLWEFNLHYFEYIIPIAYQYNRTQNRDYYDFIKEAILGWIANNNKYHESAWHPYTISMRIPNWLIAFELCVDLFADDREFQNVVWKSIFDQYTALKERIEYWILGNHYFENLKCLVICSLVFRKSNEYNKYVSLLLKELSEQILTDGVHFELSLMYHKIIIEDLIRLVFFLRTYSCKEVDDLLYFINIMISALYSLEFGLGRTPLFNDAADNVSKPSKELLMVVEKELSIVPDKMNNFIESGYFKRYGDRYSLIFDAGKIGPDYQPGHAHCDCLSFELSFDNIPLFVNAGTYQYQGKDRSFFRSTRAHNTFMVGDREQSDLWGEHRAGNRISCVKAEYSDTELLGRYKSFRGDKFVRKIDARTKHIYISDSVETSSSENVCSYLRIAPDHIVEKRSNQIYIYRNDLFICSLSFSNCTVEILGSDSELSRYAPNMGDYMYCITLLFTWLKGQNRSHLLISFDEEK